MLPRRKTELEKAFCKCSLFQGIWLVSRTPKCNNFLHKWCLFDEGNCNLLIRFEYFSYLSIKYEINLIISNARMFGPGLSIYHSSNI